MQKLGVREICEVVLKAKTAQKIGNKVFYKNEPVMYFDTLKTSSLEGAATTVYANGGRGNSKLVAWEGERTLTFNMEDALISPEGLSILTGAGLIDASKEKPVYQHIVETTDCVTVGEDGHSMVIYVDHKPYLPSNKQDNFAYVMIESLDGEMSEPLIPAHGEDEGALVEEGEYKGKYALRVSTESYKLPGMADEDGDYVMGLDLSLVDHVVVDYYCARTSGARQIEITAEKFGGNYYLEASTLFRDTNGMDVPAEFIIPNCKVQSNFTFSMASTGDPSTFSFVLDAFPDYTRFDRTHKVLCALQVINTESPTEIYRRETNHEAAHDALFAAHHHM